MHQLMSRGVGGSMTCANIFLTVAAAVTFIFGVWPGIGGAATPWVLGITAIGILIMAWTGVTCTWCSGMAKPAAKAKKAK